MTAKQIEKAIAKAGIKFSEGEIEITRDQVTVCVGYYVSGNGYGTCNESKTWKLAKQVAAILGWSSGFSTGYGATVLQPGKLVDMGDYNDVCSRWHY